MREAPNAMLQKLIGWLLVVVVLGAALFVPVVCNAQGNTQAERDFHTIFSRLSTIPLN